MDLSQEHLDDDIERLRLISLFLQPEIQSEYCLCQGSITLPVLPAPSTALNDPSSSCAYTSLPVCTSVSAPATTPAITSLGPATTVSAQCSVCSPYVLNGQRCTSIPNCDPHTPSAFVEVGSSPVHVVNFEKLVYFNLQSDCDTLPNCKDSRHSKWTCTYQTLYDIPLSQLLLRHLLQADS